MKRISQDSDYNLAVELLKNSWEHAKAGDVGKAIDFIEGGTLSVRNVLDDIVNKLKGKSGMRTGQKYQQEEVYETVRVINQFEVETEDHEIYTVMPGEELTLIGLWPDFYEIDFNGYNAYADIGVLDANTELVGITSADTYEAELPIGGAMELKEKFAIRDMVRKAGLDDDCAVSLIEYLESHEDLKVCAAGWEDLPKGWTRASAEKFWKSIGGDVTACMNKMKGKVTDTGAFCASLKDMMEGTTKWRGPE